MLVSIDKTVHVWEIDQSEPSYKIESPIKIISSAVFHKDCRKLYVCGNSDILFEIDVYTRAKKGCKLPESDIRCISINNESNFIALGTSTGNIHIIDVKEFNIVKTLSKYKFAITSIDFLKDQKSVIAGDSSGHLITGSVDEDARDYAEFTSLRGPVLSLCTLENGDVAAFQSKSLYIYDMYHQEILDVQDFGQSAIIKINPIGGNLLVGTNNGKLFEYNQSDKSLIKITKVSHAISAIAVNPDGVIIAIAYLGGLSLLNLQDPSANIDVPCNHKEFITCLVYQHNFIAIPDDAIFETDTTNPSQIWISRSKLSASRLTNSMKISGMDLFPEEEDFSVDKFTFRRKLVDIASNNSDRTAGSKVLSRSGISREKITRRSLNTESNEIQVSGQLSFSNTGSPVFKHRKISRQSKIESPSISDFPLRQNDSETTSPKEKSPKENSISPIVSTSTPIKTPSKVRFGNNVTPTKPEEEKHVNFNQINNDDEEIHASDFSSISSPINDTSSKLEQVNDGLMKTYDEVHEKVQEAEEKLAEDNQ
ncbi:tricorn protease domain 2 family [Trichomonas vaginalis G3]|nr:tricorn protease domain 2 family [Trichomonas vaginalis G3]KAI5533119.1 tricorn protease domain 2 family [Trichomonas vaginalis G3]